MDHLVLFKLIVSQLRNVTGDVASAYVSSYVTFLFIAFFATLQSVQSSFDVGYRRYWSHTLCSISKQHIREHSQSHTIH